MTTTPDVLELTRALLRFDTINPPGQEAEMAGYLAGVLSAGGFSTNLLEYAPGRANLLARLDGAGGDLPLCLSGHMDVVPLGTKPWSHDPFAGEVAGGRIYGRGSSDMKAGLAAMAVAALRMAAAGRPRRGLVVAFSVDEETGCRGARMMGQSGRLGRAGALVVGEPTGNQPVLGHKGAFWLKISFSGKTAHGSMPEMGDNAIYKAVAAVEKIRRLEIGPAHPLLGRPTVSVNTIQGGVKLNVVPDSAWFEMDGRTVPGRDHDSLLAEVRELMGPEASVEVVDSQEAVTCDPAHPWVAATLDMLSGFLGERPRPRGASYFTDASALVRALGQPPVILLGPGDPEQAHQTDESCRVEAIHQAVEIYTEIARRYCLD